MKKIVTVIEPEGPESWFSELNDVAEVRFFYPNGPISPSNVDLITAESDCIIITSSTAISNDQLKKTTRLRMIAKCGGPPSNIDVGFAGKLGIAVSCVPGANTSTIAEYAVMLILATLKQYGKHVAAVRNKLWRWDIRLGRDLRDSVIGIVGLGAIGSEVLRMLQPFGCKILIYSPHANRNFYSSMNCKFCDSLEQMLPECDAVTLHASVNRLNRGFFNSDIFALMKPTAVFINTARGALVNENDLADALNKGIIAAAAVDVYETEPPYGVSPLLSCKNAILTPHTACWTEGALKRECFGAVASTMAYLKGQNIPGLLNDVH